MRLLLIEDNEDHKELISDYVDSVEGLELELDWSSTFKDGLAKLKHADYDLCLCDLSLPDSSTSETVERLSQNLISIPVVALTSLEDSRITNELLRSGIQDFIEKEDLSPKLLRRSCWFAVERHKHQQTIEDMNNDMRAFCASLSHDFNGSISRIVSISGVLRQEVEAKIEIDEELTVWFDYLESSANRVHKLTADLERYLSIGSEDIYPEIVDLHALTQEVVSELQGSSMKAFEAIYDGTLHEVRGSQSLISVLIQNLVANAVKYTEDSAQVRFATRRLERGVQFSVTDNGVGFEAKNSEEIFKPFARLAKTKERAGSGLGLSIVKRIVELHGGKIEAVSSPGEGSTFTILFPDRTAL